MQYLQVNGDRIVGISDWDGKGNPPQDNLRKAPDGITSDWIGKSYDAAVLAGSKSKDGKTVSAKDAPEGKRPEAINPPGGLHASGEALNTNMGDATMAMEHPIDPVLGSEMRTKTPNMVVTVVPPSQPKTADQTDKDAGREVKKPSTGAARHAPSTRKTDEPLTADTPAARALAAAENSDTTADRKAKAGVR